VIKLSSAKLRGIALAQQGLLNRQSQIAVAAPGTSAGTAVGKSAKKEAVAASIAHLGYVQIDTISVVERAHHHVLWTRVKNYKPEYLDAVVAEKKVFEYWFHAAAFLPMSDYRFALPRMNAIKSGEKHWFANIDKKLLRKVYRRIQAEGPLRARDFADTKSTNTGWWDWKPAKQALEQLFMQGDLMVVGREGFQKRYDLTERVLPDGTDTSTPNIAEEAQFLIDTTIRAHGLASLKSFTYLRKGRALRIAVRDCLEAYIDMGRVVLIQSPGGDEFYCDPELPDQKHRPSNRVQLLSPFDNLVIQRERCRQLFEFDYQIECYVPEAKRQYGYFCLPVLYKDKLVGRIDCKAQRKTEVLQVQYLQHEAVEDTFLPQLAEALKSFMQFNICTSVEIRRTEKKSTAKLLQKCLAAKDIALAE